VPNSKGRLLKDFPAWTVVGVSALALPELLFEVKATAVIGSGAF
jgi:enamine deaminase RidA (YjgF/YER057c/UK114 family)